MKRRKFIQKSVLVTGGLASMTAFNSSYVNRLKASEKMPVLFLGHGNPMNAIQENSFTKAWSDVAKNIPKPQAILVVSAHWETRGGSYIYGGKKPKTIHDMYGFPQELYNVQYPAFGAPELAQEMVKKMNSGKVKLTEDWGLDHGAWSVLVKMYPEADIPCFQISLNYTRDLDWHFNFARQMQYLRSRGVLIIGSGNIVHNLKYIRDFYAPAPDWALEFDQWVVETIQNGDFQQLGKYQLANAAGLISVNSAEHYIPLLYAMALKEPNDEIRYFNDKTDGTLEEVMMRCVLIG